MLLTWHAADTWQVRAYADKLIDVLDPSGRIFRHRLYREHCTPLEGCYTKDLRALGRDLAATVLVENTPLSFCFQVPPLPSNHLPSPLLST